MPQYLSPGVYVEEVDAGPKPIEGVSTSMAGAVGVTARGPDEGKPVLITSFADFQRIFGGVLAEPDPSIAIGWKDPAGDGGHWWRFALSVKAFFENGGQQMFVKRVLSSTAALSSSFFGEGLISRALQDAAVGATVVKVENLINVEEGASIDIVDGSDPGTSQPATILDYSQTKGTVTLTAGLTAAVVADRGDYMRVTAPTSTVPSGGTLPANSVLQFKSKDVGLWGDNLRVRTGPMVGATLNLVPNPASAAAPLTATTTAVVAVDGLTIPIDDIDGFISGDHVLINGSEWVLTAPAVAGTGPGTIDIESPNPAIAPLAPHAEYAAGTVVKFLQGAGSATAPDVWAFGASSRLYTGALIELDNGVDKEYTTVKSLDGNKVELDAAAGLVNDFVEGNKLRLIEVKVDIQWVVDGNIEAEENFTNLRLVDDGSAAFIVNFINDRSDLVDVTTEGAYPSSPAVPGLADMPVAPGGGSFGYVSLTGGADGYAALKPDDFVGVDGGPGKRTGIQALEEVDEVSIVLAPNMWSPLIHGAMITHCELLKDRMCIVDPPNDLSIQDIQAFRNAYDTKYGALYYPWLVQRDFTVGRNVVVAPSGHMAGIYARSDNERGVHKAPANEVVRDIVKFNQEIIKREQDLLNPDGINALRFFPGRGYRVWGARTMSSDGSWKYINVRRLFLFVEESIEEGTQFAVFEPNDEPLWARIRLTITNFLTTVWLNGALQGATAAEAFFVKCDRSTMTQDDIDNGRLICLIGIAPVKPAEFVIFRIQQKTLDNQV